MKIGDIVTVKAGGVQIAAEVTELAPRQVRLLYRAPGYAGKFEHWFHTEGGPRPGVRMGDHGEPPHRFEVRAA